MDSTGRAQKTPTRSARAMIREKEARESRLVKDIWTQGCRPVFVQNPRESLRCYPATPTHCATDLSPAGGSTHLDKRSKQHHVC